MTKSYADQCLERAEKATEGPWYPLRNRGTSLDGENDFGEVGVMKSTSVEAILGGALYVSKEEFDKAEDNIDFIAHARTDVPELARRLNIACQLFKTLAMNTLEDPQMRTTFIAIADELEAMPEEE